MRSVIIVYKALTFTSLLCPPKNVILGIEFKLWQRYNLKLTPPTKLLEIIWKIEQITLIVEVGIVKFRAFIIFAR